MPKGFQEIGPRPRAECPLCGREVAMTQTKQLRSHRGTDRKPCHASGYRPEDVREKLEWFRARR